MDTPSAQRKTTHRRSTGQLHRKQIAAIQLAIGALERERRRNHAAGEHAYQCGMRTSKINANGITGKTGAWAEEAHRQYTQYTISIQELQDLIEILQDPEAINAQERLL